MAEIVQPLWWSACASTSSSRVSMEQGSLVVLVVVEDRQLRGSPTPDGGPHKVGNFSEQNWGDSGERDHNFRIGIAANHRYLDALAAAPLQGEGSQHWMPC